MKIILNFFLKNNNEIWFLLPIIFVFYISGYDFICLNDENLLFSIVATITILIYYNYSNFIVLFHYNNKEVFIKEYYYKFYLIKTFYLIYINYLKYSFLTYNNYNNYYNYYYNYLKNLIVIFSKKNFALYFKFFFNYLNTYMNQTLFKFIELNFLIALNIYYLTNILKFLNLK